MREVAEKLRFVLMLILTLMIVSLGVLRLMRIQLVEGDEYLEKSKSVRVAAQVINAPRGEIMDKNGEYLVKNRSGFNVVALKAFFPDDNETADHAVYKTACVLSEYGCEWTDVLPVTDKPPFEFLPDRERDVERLRKAAGVQVYGTAEDCITALRLMYGVDDEYDERAARVTVGLRYSMQAMDFSVSNRFTVAEDVPMEAVVALKELSDELPGIDISEEAVRVNLIGDVVPHLIGTVGLISAEEYDAYKDSGYALNDKIGKGGIEKAMEPLLRGTKGERSFEISEGEVVKDEVTSPAVPGCTVKLTVESGFQREIQTLLENHIAWLSSQTSPEAKGTGADAGAAVVLDAKTGALLAAATYPTYDLLDYIEDYDSVAGRENSPLTNRATSGYYRPGSTFKTVTATAALNEGVISPYDTVNCTHYYTYWEDWKPYPECTGWHGRLNVVQALKESCNIFFYDVGRLTGISKLAEYASLYGLGEEMGLEIGRDVKTGYVASPDTFSERGLDWEAGNVIQAAIGQSDTYITPLQMAAQAMTIANKGVRYQTYMVDSAYDYNMTSCVYQAQPVVAAQIPDKTGYTFSTVTQGMIEAGRFEQYINYPHCSDYYTQSYLLTDLPYDTAIKTGTPQMRGKEDTDSAVIGFYPADDPQIAFAVYIEHGEYSKFMVKDIIRAYFDDSFIVRPLSEWTEEEAVQALSDTQDPDTF